MDLVQNQGVMGFLRPLDMSRSEGIQKRLREGGASALDVLQRTSWLVRSTNMLIR
uniref:Uncharacterized protein n=1 Tax=Heterorhabditis bacteriophora TaxID=37862 RepID=A0A1I7WFY3_HETBA